MGRKAMQPEKIDRKRVSLARATEEIYWTARLGATREAVERAIAAVGTNPDRVADWLAQNHLCHERPGPSRTPAAAP
jgi:hypothetical protein